MKSFRIVDTKFRILSKGRVGMFASVAVGAMITFGATSAYATEYFSSNVSTADTYTDTVGTPHTVSRLSAVTAAALTRSSTDLTDDAIFRPYGVASTYVGVDGVDTGTQVFGVLGVQDYTVYQSQFVYNPTSQSGASYSATSNGTYNGVTLTGVNSGAVSTNTLTFASGANTHDIYKWDAIDYHTDGEYTYYTSGTGSTAYTANLVFNGVNTVSGFTNIDNGTITIAGSNVNFAGTVQAGAINIGGSGVYFNSNVDLNGGNMTFDGGYGVTLHAGMNDGNVNFAGNNGTLTIDTGNLVGNIDTTASRTGTLAFGTNGATSITGNVGSTAALKEIQLNGTGISMIDGSAKAVLVNLNTAGTLSFGGGLDTRLADGTLGQVNFNNYDGTVQIGNNSNLYGNVTTDTDNNGKLTMISGTQSINGQVGTSGKAIKILNIGGQNTGGLDNSVNNYSTTTAYGDIYVTDTVLNNNGTTNNSSLIMATDYDLYSTVTTTDNGAGVLTLAGGVQNVTGNVGTNGMRLDQVNSGANGATSNFGSFGAQTDVYADTVSNIGTGTTNFSRNVTATTINVASGISNFTNNVTATTTTIGSGVANFNTNGTGTTTSDIVFSASTSAITSDTGSYTTAELGSATANLINGLSGAVTFAGNDATVNVWDAKAISGAITTATNSNTGTVNYRGDGTITSTVGVTGMGIKELNINTNNEQSTASGVIANGNIYAGIVNLKNNATLTLADGTDITGTTTSETNVAALTGTAQVIAAALDGNGAHTGTVKMLGTSVITGVVGTDAASIATIEAGTTGKIVTFNNMVYAQNLIYSGNGTVVLNGQAGVDAATAGMKGTVDFGTGGTGTLQIGDGVNLTTGTNGIQFANANGATMTFNGNSTVTGVLGGDTAGRSTFKEIFAGANGKTVNFLSDVYNMEGSGTFGTFYVNGTGTVNFQGNLYGDLVYLNDGVVNVSNGKSILVNTVPVAVTTLTDGVGTLNYLGSTTLDTDIGTSAAMLKSVTFNASSNNVTQNIGHNVYSDTVTIGGTSGTAAIFLADVTGVYDYAGATTMKEYRGGTAANVTADVALGGDLTIANDTSAINFGKSHVTVGLKHDGITAGNFDTNGGAMSFTVNTLDISNNYTGTGTATSTDSALVSVVGNLTMDGDENVHINYVGSLANSGSYTVINAAGGTAANATVNTVVAGAYNQNENGHVSDNSFAIDTRVATNATGDLVVYADRTGAASGSTYAANQNYVQKSATMGDFSNNAAVVLGGIAAAGNQTGDMVQVIQKIDIDSFGYGNNQANLAVQAKRLAPIANTSLSQSAIGANTLTLNTISNRIADLRGDSVILPSAGRTGMSAGDESAKNGAWVKLIASTATQDKDGMYDGYKTRSGGLAMGIDHQFNSNVTVGAAFGYTHTNVDQKDFRSGDQANTDSYNIVAYASKDFERAYVEGALSYAHHDTDSSRAAAVGRTAHADIDANQYTGHVSAGYRFNVNDKATVAPFLALDYTHLTQDAYTETGAGAINLSVDEMSINRTTVGGGVRLGTKIDNASTTLRPELKLAAYHISGGTNTDVAAQYVGGGAKFVTPGTDLNNMMYNVGLGLKAQINAATSLGLTVDYDRSSNGLFEGYTGQLVGRYEF